MGEHLRELKSRLIWIAAAYFGSLGFWLLIPAGAFDPSALFTGLYRPAISLVLANAASLSNGRITIIAGSLTAPLEIYFIASALLAAITASPVIGYELYRFVDPGLLPNEKRTLYRFMTAFVGLFVGGATIGYFVLTPAIIRFMAYFAYIAGAQPIVTAGDYYGMVFIATGATAVAFTTPAFFLLLVNFSIISTSAFTKNRLIVYFALYVTIAAITPEPVVGHFGMFFPIVIMLELSVLIGKRMEKNRALKNAAKQQPPREVNCRYCGALSEPGKVFCPKCGRALS